MRRILNVLIIAAPLAACASDGAETPPTPNFVEAPGLPAPPQARFYVECITQAAVAGTLDREENLLRFRCSGAPALAFYDGLAAWSARVGSETVHEGRTWRFTQPIRRNPTGLDFCSRGGLDDHRCTVVLNVGEFLDF